MTGSWQQFEAATRFREIQGFKLEINARASRPVRQTARSTVS